MARQSCFIEGTNLSLYPPYFIFNLSSPCAPSVSTIFCSLKFALPSLRFATFFARPKRHCDVLRVFDRGNQHGGEEKEANLRALSMHQQRQFATLHRFYVAMSLPIVSSTFSI